MRAPCPLQEEQAGRDRVGAWEQPRYTRHPGAGEPEGPQGQASQMGMKRGMMIKRGTAGLYGVRTERGATRGRGVCRSQRRPIGCNILSITWPQAVSTEKYTSLYSLG